MIVINTKVVQETLFLYDKAIFWLDLTLSAPLLLLMLSFFFLFLISVRLLFLSYIYRSKLLLFVKPI